MEAILHWINIIGIILTAALTLYMVLTFRKPRPVSAWGKLLSILISLAMVFFFVLISGADLNLLVAGAVFLIGGILGFIRGLSLRFVTQDERVVARGTWLFLLVWGGSWVIAQLFNFIGTRLLASLGLIPVFFSTGTQLGLDGILLLRRILAHFRPPPVSKAAS